ILPHGWPSAFIELLPLVPLLSDPRAHGIEGPAFDLVIPSLPGYGFSGRPARANYRSVAALWHRLMSGLGYERYGAGGGDFGAGVTTLMALDEPRRMIGIHLSNLELSPWMGEGSRPLSSAERAYLAQRQRWDESERGYSSEAADAGIRAERFAGRPRRVDPGEVAILGRHRRFSRGTFLSRLPPHPGDALLGDGDGHDVDARLLRQSLAWDLARAERLRPGSDRHRQFHDAAHLRRRSAARMGGASLRRPPVDPDAPRRALRAGGGARAAGPRPRELLRRSLKSRGQALRVLP